MTRNLFPSSQRAQVTVLACTLPKDSGKPLSRWSSSELAKAGEIIVCTDEKTCIQALKLAGGVTPAVPGKSVRRGDRYKRLGISNLFAGLLVHTGETLVRFFERKRFEDFKAFLQMIFGSIWTRNIRVLHLILDNGPTHATKQIEGWIAGLRLPFEVQVHWLPVHASWLDQVEIVFSPLQRKVLTPRHCSGLPELEERVLAYFEEQNKNPGPINWSYTAANLHKRFTPSRMAEVSDPVEGFRTAEGGTKTPAPTVPSAPGSLFERLTPTAFVTRLGRVIRRATARGEFEKLFA